MKLFGSKKNVVNSGKPVAMLEDLEGRSMMAATLPTTAKLGMSTVAAKLGEPIALMARIGSVSPDTTVPTGRAAFYINSTLIGSKKLSSVGTARFTIPTLFNGSYSLKTIYLGDTTHLGHRSPARTLAVSTPTLTTSGTGLQKATVVAGSGTPAVTGNVLTVNYTGYFTNGSIFDTSLQTGRSPFPVTLGAHGVIEGWEEGLLGAKVGETRLLIIPSTLAYGPNDYNGIPGGSTLVFVVSVLAKS